MTNLTPIRMLIHEVQDVHRTRQEMVRGQNVPYRRRGEMSIPAFKMKSGGDPATEGREQSIRLMKKATTLPVDFIFFDLEDAAPDHPQYKPFGRGHVVEALRGWDFGKRVVAFRPNNIRTAFFEEDMVQVVGEAGDRLHALVIPKTETADEVKDIARLVTEIQRIKHRDNKIMLEVLIESARGVLEAERIAAIPEVAALIFGPYDFARTTGGRVEPTRWTSDQVVVRQMLPILAAAHGKDAVDGITGTLPVRPKAPPGVTEDEVNTALAQPPESLDPARFGAEFIRGVRAHQQAVELARRDALDARCCGFAAKWILHPDQIAPVQGAWTPSRQEALAALHLVASYTRAALAGSGAELDGQRLTDKAVVGAEWWNVEAALNDGVLGVADVDATGFTLEQLKRTCRTRD